MQFIKIRVFLKNMKKYFWKKIHKILPIVARQMMFSMLRSSVQLATSSKGSGHMPRSCKGCWCAQAHAPQAPHLGWGAAICTLEACFRDASALHSQAIKCQTKDPLHHDRVYPTL